MLMSISICLSELQDFTVTAPEKALFGDRSCTNSITFLSSQVKISKVNFLDLDDHCCILMFIGL